MTANIVTHNIQLLYSVPPFIFMVVEYINSDYNQNMTTIDINAYFPEDDRFGAGKLFFVPYIMSHVTLY